MFNADSDCDIKGNNIGKAKEYIDYFSMRSYGETFRVCISFCHIQSFNNSQTIESFLHDEEIKYYNTLIHERRINSFLLGRYSAKKAISQLTGEDSLKKIRIKNGVFNQPIVVCDSCSNIQVSLSHCNDIGAAVAFEDSLIVGIDIEKITYRKNRGLEAQLTDYEKGLDYGISYSYENFLFMLWTIKESLSKALKTGLTLDFHIVEVKSIQEHDGYFVGTFTNFIQYKSVSFFIKNYVYSIVYPINVEVDINIKKIKENLTNLLS